MLWHCKLGRKIGCQCISLIEATACPNYEDIRDPLLVEREKTHGSFHYNAELYKALMRAFEEYGPPINFSPVHSLATIMIMLKIARMRQTPNVKDHWDDIAGYAKLGAEACDE